MAPAVQMWMDEEPLYEVQRRRCRDFACGHFTQVVWPTTERIGCAVGPGDSGGWTNLICNYDPPGNYGFWGDDAGNEVDGGVWYYFDPPPFGEIGAPLRVAPSRLPPG